MCSCWQVEVHWIATAGRQVVRMQHVAAHSSGWRIFKVGSGVVAPRAGGEQDQRRVTLEVSASTLAGRPLPLSLHHGTHGTRQPLLILFSSHADTNQTTTTVPVPATGKQDTAYKTKRQAKWKLLFKSLQIFLIFKKAGMLIIKPLHNLANEWALLNVHNERSGC